ncbi:ABC transporter ATP-binding protein [Mycolicibacterium sp. 018/SC-01/001]|uniref:ABC transporter ATP-binding protein n=1 Tax=Mycolicibacterium sp. 018/SC-01/001 TaxID=2592069 RepID=UPI0011808B7E|nr:ABC transporter ATP-binding protein [Mycolicibacterium sp. 018/SC-01/001]TRW80973.1 ABC transporter ATP-binding protein [Mycolicibacterium sp. 018/SC-01/001]
MTESPLLSITELAVTARHHRSRRTLVRDVALSVAAAESLGLVGESGSGKSMTIKAAMRLLPTSAEAAGRIDFAGRDVMTMNRKALAQYRSRDVALIHQDPRAHVNPTRTIGQFLIEGPVATGQLSKADATERACALMRDVGIADAERRMAQYPHQLSGGLLQRVMIVAALLPEPSLIFADEPTTALDVTVQSDVMAILLEQIRERKVAMVFVTHDLDLAAAVTDRLAVMYAGSIVETGRSSEICERPLHPYTAGLLRSRPSTTDVQRMIAIPGRPVAAFEAGPGCSFAPRCPFVADRCRSEAPQRRMVAGRAVACHRVEEIVDQLEMRAS